MSWTLDDIKAKPCAKRNPELFPPDPVDRPGKADDFNGPDAEPERDLQAKCESFLESRGYRRRTAANADTYSIGWYAHMQNPQGNPFMADLWVIKGGRILEVELKTRNRFQPGQREMVERGEWSLCWCFAEFVRVFEAWAKAEPRIDANKHE